MDISKVDKIVDNYKGSESSLLAIMQDVQDELRYLPREAMEKIAQKVGIPVTNVYRMATFFESFHLEPRGEHICTVCMGTACHVRGAKRLVEELERNLEIPSGTTTADMKFTIEEVNCVGACALGPLVIIDGKYHGSMNSGKLSRVVGKMKSDKGDK